jgi:glutamate-1-semialdehyde 2,1-aminomutase
VKLNFTHSNRLNESARSVMPGGVSSPVRSFNSVGGSPFVARSGKGAFIQDVDGNEYIDLVGSWGPLIHGHSHPTILEAVREELSRGSSYGITCESEIKLCQKIVEAVPSVEMIRLVNSGTEACMSAIRLARAATGRELIVKFEGHYHGHADPFLVAAGSGLATLGTSSSDGVPEAQVKSTICLPFNSVESLELAFQKYGDRIAAVILEVVSGNMGVILPEMEFLQSLRKLCDQSKSLLIFDEVMTGFRLSLAGAQGIYPIKPDLSCFGKVIGAGFPVAAYGGRRDLMQLVAPLGPMYQAGTLSGNPVGTAAGLASLNLILENPNHFFQNLDSAGSEWKAYLEAHITHKSYPVCVEQTGSMLSLFFRPEIPKNFSEAKDAEIHRFKTFFWSLLEDGVYYPPSAFESCFLSSAHDGVVMEKVAEASVRALDRSFSKS